MPWVDVPSLNPGDVLRAYHIDGIRNNIEMLSKPRFAYVRSSKADLVYTNITVSSNTSLTTALGLDPVQYEVLDASNKIMVGLSTPLKVGDTATIGTIQFTIDGVENPTTMTIRNTWDMTFTHVIFTALSDGLHTFSVVGRRSGGSSNFMVGAAHTTVMVVVELSHG